MPKYPQRTRDFRAWFSDEAACRAYLERIRWPKGPRCPRCPRAKVWEMRPPFYRCARCGYDFTVTVHTLFADTHLPLSLWFELIWYVVHQPNGASALGVQRVLGLESFRTAWRCLHKLRRAMAGPGHGRLAGTVEIDELLIGSEAAGQALVLIAVQTDGTRIGRVRFARIANASKSSLRAAIERCVKPGSRVLTDNWRGYAGLKAQGYFHKIVRGTGVVGTDLLPQVKRVAYLLYEYLGRTHGGMVAPSHLDYYLDEFTFRFNRRRSQSRGILFYQLLQQALAMGPVRCDTLVGGTTRSGNS